MKLAVTTAATFAFLVISSASFAAGQEPVAPGKQGWPGNSVGAQEGDANCNADFVSFAAPLGDLVTPGEPQGEYFTSQLSLAFLLGGGGLIGPIEDCDSLTP